MAFYATLTLYCIAFWL